jgi:hypothetical protein
MGEEFELPLMWVRVASMHFDGPIAKWLQSVNHRIRKATWTELCSWIHDRFGKDQHDLLIRQLFHIKQSRSVQEYIDKLCELVDQLSAYEPSHSANSRYYATCFVDGLKHEIKSIILVQMSVDLDIAFSLELLQEEAEASRHHEFKKSDFLYKSKAMTQASPLPLPLPPLKVQADAKAVEKRSNDQFNSANADSKVAALRAYRMARGLCRFCAEKWSKGHKCNTIVQLHAVQEL